jgi:hypothetical protein
MEQEMVWFDIDLEFVPQYGVWRPESVEWALTVGWATVNDFVRNNLPGCPAGDHNAALRTAATARMSATDREGLFSLYRESIFATEHQISGGGHRIAAMRRQGLRWALGQCYLDDIGTSVDELHAYRP